MSRDPLNRETYTNDGLDADEFDNLDAVNDDHYGKSKPSTPILAPGKNESEISLRICFLGGTTLPTRFMVNTYCAMEIR